MQEREGGGGVLGGLGDSDWCFGNLTESHHRVQEVEQHQNFVLHDKLEMADSLIAKVFLRTLDFDF